MTRRISIGSALVLLASGVAVAPAAAQGKDNEFLEFVFRRYDNDGDKRVTRAEFPGSDEQFAAMDRSGDGKVTFEEFAASPTARRLLISRRKDSTAPRARRDLSALVLARLDSVAAFDTNRDGRVTKAEWTGSPTAFAELDLDRDGVLDKSDRALAKHNTPPGQRAPAALVEIKSRLPEAEKLIEKHDRNKDQQLQEREIRGQKFAPLFDSLDRNEDGALDLDELRRMVAAVNTAIYERSLGTQKPRPFKVPFRAWDKNDDGRLEATEWQERRYLFARIDQNRDAGVTVDEIQRYERAVVGDDFVSRFDLDDDGKVTLQEFGGPPDAFRRVDRNGDGVVSRADR